MSTAFFRTIILYFLIMAGLRLMGKRQIGQLEPSELVLTMMLSDLATVPMQDFGIPLLLSHTIVDIRGRDRVEGVTVLAQGGGSAVVQKEITEVMEALFGIEPHKIKVAKMGSVSAQSTSRENE